MTGSRHSGCEGVPEFSSQRGREVGGKIEPMGGKRRARLGIDSVG